MNRHPWLTAGRRWLAVSTLAATRNGSSAMKRTDAANHLAEITEKADPKAVDDATLNSMIALLDSPEESLRAGVAAALGKSWSARACGRVQADFHSAG